MRIGKPRECEGCKAKDQLIEQLQKMLDGAHQTVLAIVDREAHKARYPQARMPRAVVREPQGGGPPGPESASTPSELRGLQGVRLATDPGAPWDPPRGQSHEEIEASFLADQETESILLDRAAAEMESARSR